MNKTIIITALMLIFAVSIVSAVPVYNDRLKVNPIGESGKIKFTGSLYGGEGSVLVDYYCEHNEETFYLGQEKYLLAISKTKTTDLVFDAKTNCTLKDKAWIQVGEYVGNKVNITKKPSGSRKKIIPVEVPQINPIEQTLIDCKNAANSWYETSPKTKYNMIYYQARLNWCQYKYNEAMCESQEGMVWRSSKCIKKYIPN